MSPLPDAVRISAGVIDSIAAHARAAAPAECCGLLIGVDGDVREAVAAANGAADPTRRYEISPADYVAQIKRCRMRTACEGRTYSVVGAYHSHPNSVPEPSPTDTAEAFKEFLYVIAGPADAATIETKAYQLTDEGVRPVLLVLD